MTIIKKVLIVTILISMLSCLSNGKELTNKKTEMGDSKKENTILIGEKEEKIWIDESIIVGIVPKNNEDEDSLLYLLDKLRLESYTPSVTEISIGDFGEPSSVYFALFKRKGEQNISGGSSPELEGLRSRYWDNFGPGIYRESGEVWAVLSNVITVQFKSGITQEQIEEILKSTNAVKTLQMGENEYRVEYPKSWGYKVIDEGKKLFKRKEVRSVENLYRVIVRRT